MWGSQNILAEGRWHVGLAWLMKRSKKANPGRGAEMLGSRIESPWKP